MLTEILDNGKKLAPAFPAVEAAMARVAESFRAAMTRGDLTQAATGFTEQLAAAGPMVELRRIAKDAAIAHDERTEKAEIPAFLKQFSRLSVSR